MAVGNVTVVVREAVSIKVTVVKAPLFRPRLWLATLLIYVLKMVCPVNVEVIRK